MPQPSHHPEASAQGDSTFKITLGALLVVYLLLFISVSATPWRQTFTFNLTEMVGMALSRAYLYAASQSRRGIGRVQSRVQFERHCILYTITGMALGIVLNFQFGAELRWL